jgi:hypothetical protein
VADSTPAVATRAAAKEQILAAVVF